MSQTILFGNREMVDKILIRGGGVCILAVAGYLYLNQSACVGLIEQHNEQKVTSKTSIVGSTKVMKTEELFDLARVQAGEFLPDEAGQSFPIPIIHPNGAKFIFLFYLSHNSPNGSQIYPPDYLVRINLSTGKAEERKAVVPSDFAQSYNTNEPIGIFVLPDGMSVYEYLDKRKRLFELYDILIPEFAMKQPTSNLNTKKYAVEFIGLFSTLREPPLTAYYSAIGKEFFDWVKRSGSQ